MTKALSRVSAVALAGALLAASFAGAAEWPNWRGPNHDGISPETGFKTTWSQPPKVVWEYAVGAGFSAFACIGDKVYTCGTKGGQQIAYCLDAASGKLVWETPLEKELKDRQGGDGPRATPTVEDGRVYVFGAHGHFACLDAKDGKEIWKKQLNNKPNPSWAYAGSVLIEGDMAIAVGGGGDGGLLAVNKKTGEEIWKCTNEKAGYSTPYPFTFNGTRYIVGFLGQVAIIVEAKTGKEVWRMPWKTSYDVNASTPIFHDGLLFLSSGYGTGCAVLKLAAGDGKIQATEVWRNKTYRNKITSCVLIDGILYGGDEQNLKCVDFKTGEQKWEVPGMANATVLAAAGHLIVLSEGGKLMIAKATPAEFKPIAEASVLSGRCWTVPTLCNGKLYLRNLEKAVCLDLSAAETASTR